MSRVTCIRQSMCVEASPATLVATPVVLFFYDNRYGSPVRWLVDVGQEEQARIERIDAALDAARTARKQDPITDGGSPLFFGNSGPAPRGKPSWRHSARTRSKPWVESAVEPIPLWRATKPTGHASARQSDAADDGITDSLARALMPDPSWDAHAATRALVQGAARRRTVLEGEAEAAADALEPFGVPRSVPYGGLVPPAPTIDYPTWS
eukprot:m.15830 g.15830  ORF g.15830 m.15830 type:complete len:209 (+) comp3320_c0_seq1:1354-1980(+)